MTLSRKICLIVGLWILVCPTTFSHAEEEAEEVRAMAHTTVANPTAHKHIFVFLDGTRNDQRSKTNVGRLYELIPKMEDAQTISIYIEGVGSVDKPIFGTSLGRGMKNRILRGYAFIAEHYNAGDDIYIFGFSRGAHEARSLAGLLSYAGVPRVTDHNRDRLVVAGKAILKLAKKAVENDYFDKWASWKPGQSPLLGREIQNEEAQPVEITFLGVWDTVPGSSFKKYDECIEKIGVFKRNAYKLPIISEGERYKSGSYPPIRRIAHAVSLDEKRSKFAPLLVCQPINPQYTKVNEVWFPGAHADVGGGYEDSNALAGISLNWMIRLLSGTYPFHPSPPRVDEDTKGLAHWSIGDFPANLGSDCEDRTPSEQAQLHKSVEERKSADHVPVRVKGKLVELPYPFKCPEK